MKRIVHFLATVILLGLVVSHFEAGDRAASGKTWGQSAPGTGPSIAQVKDQPYKIDASLVNLDVLVADEDGRVLSGLKSENFRVLDDGSPQRVLHFAPPSEPVTIVILMEYSASSYSYFAAKSADWGTSFLSHLEPRDWVALVTFDLQPKVQVDFTHKQFEVRDAIGALGFPHFREVNLYDTLLDTLDKLDGVQGKASILLLATGTNSFSAATFEEVQQRLKRTNATVFCVGLAESEYLRYGGTGISYVQGKNALSSFARQTGGVAVFPRFEGELPGIFRGIVNSLRSQYSLAFRPSPEARDGRYHKLKVEIVGANGRLLRVTDEKGRERKIEVYAREGYIAPKGEMSPAG